MEFIFENYKKFVDSTDRDFSDMSVMAETLADDIAYAEFAESCLTGIEESVQPSIKAILDRRRQTILTEAATGPASGLINGFTMSSFPMITYIYAEPILSEICTLYPSEKFQLSVPIRRTKAQTMNYDGTLQAAKYIPTATAEVGVDFLSINVTPTSNTKVFTALSLPAEKFRINRRYVLLESISVKDTNAAANAVDKVITLNATPDNRNQIVWVGNFKDQSNATVNVKVQSSIDYEKGELTCYAIFTDGTAGSSYALNYGTFKIKLLPIGTLAGRTKLTSENSMIDITIDPNEDFVLELTEEDIQDAASANNIDLIKTLADAVKTQMLFQKEAELAFNIITNESDMVAVGNTSSVDLDDLNAGGNILSPSNIRDIFTAVVPKISSLQDTIYKNGGITPSYLVCGEKSFALIRSMQQVAATAGTIGRGEIGYSAQSAEFLKLKAIRSFKLPTDKIYFTSKAGVDQLSQASIVDFVHNPFYVTNEVTDGIMKKFIRSRTIIKILRTDGLGVFTISNLNKYV